MWSPMCGYFDEVERNKPIRDSLRKQFIDAQISGDIDKIKEIKKRWKDLDRKENFYLR